MSIRYLFACTMSVLSLFVFDRAQLGEPDNYRPDDATNQEGREILASISANLKSLDQRLQDVEGLLHDRSESLHESRRASRRRR